MTRENVIEKIMKENESDEFIVFKVMFLNGNINHFLLFSENKKGLTNIF